MTLLDLLADARTDLSTAAIASRLAAHGVAVFPCVPGGKRPLTEHGFHDASTDPAVIAGWWRRWPEANLALPTGPSSGVDVVDVDLKDHLSGYPAFDRAARHGLVRGWIGLVRSPSGGMHAYYPTATGQSCWQAAAAGIDFRGDGGYILIPPSRILTPARSDARYAVIAGADHTVHPVDAAALRSFLSPHPPRVDSVPGRLLAADGGRRLAGWVAGLREGERNRGLFWAACRLAEAGHDPAYSLALLGGAAARAGLPSGEVQATIRSAYRTTSPAAPAPVAQSPPAPSRVLS